MDDRNLNSHSDATFSGWGRVLITRHLILSALIVSAIGILLSLPSVASAGEPEWIWTPKVSTTAPDKSKGECFFRKKFTLVGPEQAEIVFAAGDEYELYLNNRLVVRGQSFGETTTVNASQFIEPGVNLLAVRVRHFNSVRPGLSLNFRVKEKGESRWRSLGTDRTWKTRVAAKRFWTKASFNDMVWLAAAENQFEQPADEAKPTAPVVTAQANAQVAKAQVAKAQVAKAQVAKAQVAIAPAVTAKNTKPSHLSLLDHVRQQLPQMELEVNDAPPTGVTAKTSKIKPVLIKSQPMTTARQAVAQATAPANENSRFKVAPDFSVEKILTGKETGSLIAMEFNEFGKLLLSREGGPLLISDLSLPATNKNRTRVCCEEVTSCQGILPLNGSVYVTGSGPQGVGLYELKDDNGDGLLTVKRRLLGFTGEAGEHGPHGIQFGPDGMLYVVLGNGSQPIEPVAATSPFKNFYEGDLVPRFEDPGGHAAGVKAPGGTIVRVSLNGKKIERVAGGIRNAYDLVVDSDGEIFLHDSDMEADKGTAWYRQTMAFHVPAGAELGWRSGWAKFPNYFIDQTPSLADTGRGSPTGAVLYQHVQFPARYHDTIFFADWSEGRILSVKPTPDGAGFAAKPQTFLAGRPLNVCDLAVGKDGGLYFCTGGRGTEGGVYRVSWNGEVPASLTTFENDLVKVLRLPQPQSPWARQEIAQVRIKMANQWGPAIQGVATETRNTTKMRLRALQLMGMYGPLPTQELLDELASDNKPAIRAQVARMCVRKSDSSKKQIVLELINDKSPYVRRVAAETCVRLGIAPDFNALAPMLISESRIEALAARRLLERIPADQWQAKIFSTDNKQLFLNGSVAMLTSAPSLDRAYQVLAKSSELMEGFLNDREFTDLLRTMQLALVRGQVDPARIPGLTLRIASEFPSASSPINRELVRILGYLKAGDFNGRLDEYLASEETSVADKVHVAMHLLAAKENLTDAERFAVVDALETSRFAKGAGGSYDQYLQNAIAQISSDVAGSDVQLVLANGHRWPKTTLAAFFKMPEKIDAKTVDAVIAMDRRIKELGATDHPSKQVRLGVIAILARDGSQAGMEYLRSLWQQESKRRSDIVIGLAQQPDGENWAYLVGSLPQLDDLTGAEVLQQLLKVNQRPQDAKHYREVIQLGHRLRGKGAEFASQLLFHWSGESHSPEGEWKDKLATWNQWYETKFPQAMQFETALNQNANQNAGGIAGALASQNSTGQIMDQIEAEGLGSAQRGHAVFAKAQCATCHRLGSQGQGIGPDLTNLAARFSMRETVESMVHPAAVIPDRYRSKLIQTVDGLTLEGMTVTQDDGSLLVLTSQGKRIQVAADDVQAMAESKKSAMPAGLLNGLTTNEVADLMAYLMEGSSSQVAEQSNQPAARIGAMPTVKEIR